MTNKQARIYKLLSNGSRYTVIDIAMMLHIGDPRSVIRCMRRNGVIINDEWVNTKTSRFKRFWIDAEKTEVNGKKEFSNTDGF